MVDRRKKEDFTKVFQVTFCSWHRSKRDLQLAVTILLKSLKQHFLDFLDGADLFYLIYPKYHLNMN